MQQPDQLLRDALEHSARGGTSLIVARDPERMRSLMRTLTELSRRAGAETVAIDDRTVRTGDGICAFFTPESIDFVLGRGHFFASRVGPAPKVLWDAGARERADEVSRTMPEEPVDRSHLLFGKVRPEYDERRRRRAGPCL